MRSTRFFSFAGRISLALAVVALLAAWISEPMGGSVAGLSQQHLFSDAIALGVLGIAGLLDALLHSKGL